MNEKQMRKADFLSSVGLMIFGITVTVLSWRMPRLEEKDINPYTAPGTVPGALGVILLVLALIMFVRTVRQGGFLPRFSAQGFKSLAKSEGILRLGVALLLCLVYALGLIGRLPYPLATFLFVFAFVLSFDLKFDAVEGGKRRIILTALLQAVITSCVISAAFQYLFLVDLP